MAGLTPRFKFNMFGAGTPGTLTDDGQKYTSIDRLKLDRLLAAIEAHDHRYVPPATGLVVAPTGQLLDGIGQLSAGYTYHYRVSVVDSRGNESIASPELHVGTPTPLAPPAMPGLYNNDDTPSGTLTAGFYYYALTGLRGNEESTIGPAAMISLVEGETAVQIELPELGAAEQFQIWRMGSNDAGFTRIGVQATGTFTDTGATPPDPCACDPGVAPPPVNTGIASYAIRVTLPVETNLTDAVAWRLYRTVNAGLYPTAALVHEVVERTDEWDINAPLVREWLDTGGNLAIGQPQLTDQNMRFQVLTLDHVDAAPAVTGYPDYYPMVIDGVLRIKVGDAWVSVEEPYTYVLDVRDALPTEGAFEMNYPIIVGGVLYRWDGAAWVEALDIPEPAPAPTSEPEPEPEPQPESSSILTSPDGSRWVLTVDNTGSLVTTRTDLAGPPVQPTVTTTMGTT